MGIFGGQELALLQCLRIAGLFVPEFIVFALEQRHRRDIAAGRVQRVAWRQRCHLQWIEQGAGDLAQHRKRVGAGIDHQQDDGDQRKNDDLGTG